MKGILKILEVLIVIALVSGLYLSLFRFPDGILELETAMLKKRGFEALKVLDSLNKLANHALENNTEEIKTELGQLLPIDVKYEIVVCSQECPKISVNSEKVTSVSYFIAGNVSQVEPREILLYMWR